MCETEIKVKVAAKDLVSPLNKKVLEVVQEISPDKVVPLCWLCSVLKQVNVDLECRLFPTSAGARSVHMATWLHSRPVH